MRMCRCIQCFAVLAAMMLPVVPAAGITVEVAVDATELPRKLLHATMTFPAESDSLTLWYPKWIPGIHAPKGPIENMSGLRFETSAGDALEWKRDPLERFRFVCGTRGEKVTVKLDYICSQPSTNSNGVDSFGNSLCGIINWNTCLLYPGGHDASEIEVRLSLRLPEGWRYGTSLETERVEGGWIHFAPATLEVLIDSPLITGQHFRSIQLDAEGIAPVSLELTSESAGALQWDGELVGRFAGMAAEAGAMFGGAHFENYKLLVVCSDEMPSMGLEHLRSSLNGVDERELMTTEGLEGWAGGLLPHEFVHSWCGKFRRPAAMATPDYHAPKDTRLLWVYEGLTTHLGKILCARGGLWSEDHFKEVLADTLSNYLHQTGRQWRPLEDTAADSYHLRARSAAWSRMRRSQDYYNEGHLMWLEADAIIRNATDGARSLDDFCQAFMGPDLPKTEKLAYTEEDVIKILGDIAEHDWREFIEARVSRTQEMLPLTLVGRLGYRLQYGTEPSDYLKNMEKERGAITAQDSLGLSFSRDGAIRSDVVPGMPGDLAGLAPGMKVVGVNDRKFSASRIRDAIADSVTNRKIEFLVLDGEVFKTFAVDYADGPKYLELVRDEEKPDVLGDIIEARAE